MDPLQQAGRVHACHTVEAGDLAGMQRAQGAGEALHTRMWDVQHTFNQEMQTAAFDWLDRRMKA